MAFGKQHSVATAKRPVPPPTKPGGTKSAKSPGGTPSAPPTMSPSVMGKCPTPPGAGGPKYVKA